MRDVVQFAIGDLVVRHANNVLPRFFLDARFVNVDYGTRTDQCGQSNDGEDVVAGNTLVVSRKMDVQSIPVTADEIEKILKGELVLPTPEDNSYLEIRVNLIQKLRLKNAADIRVGGHSPPNSE